MNAPLLNLARLNAPALTNAALAELRRHDDADVRRIARDETVCRAIAMRSGDVSLFRIAEVLGVTKDWLREYAGLR
jgi:hypothetical protein